VNGQIRGEYVLVHGNGTMEIKAYPWNKYKFYVNINIERQLMKIKLHFEIIQKVNIN
jgi:hypothetical protein